MTELHDHRQYVTRFAPSPTGRLHKGHAYSAFCAYEEAQKHAGRFILRIEDIDTTRCKPEYTEGIYEDLRWLGLEWDQPVRVQSAHFDEYAQALDKLKSLNVVYPCFCTRKDIQAEIAKSKSAPHGPDGPIYPGICRSLPSQVQQEQIDRNIPHAWRLDLNKALTIIDEDLFWQDELAGQIRANPQELGDIVLARKDTPTSYHLSVVVDDALQGITHIIRGEDLFHATHIHIVLQKLLGLDTPIYKHHRLLLDDTGVRFAKRNKSVTLESLRHKGISPNQLLSSFQNI